MIGIVVFRGRGSGNNATRTSPAAIGVTASAAPANPALSNVSLSLTTDRVGRRADGDERPHRRHEPLRHRASRAGAPTAALGQHVHARQLPADRRVERREVRRRAGPARPRLLRRRQAPLSRVHEHSVPISRSTKSRSTAIASSTAAGARCSSFPTSRRTTTAATSSSGPTDSSTTRWATAAAAATR